MKRSLIIFSLVVVFLIAGANETYAMHSSYINLIGIWHLQEENTDVVKTKTPVEIMPNETYTVVVDYTTIAQSFIDDYNNDGSMIPLIVTYDGIKQEDKKDAIMDTVNKRVYVEFNYNVSEVSVILPVSNSEKFMLYKGAYSDFKGFYPFQKSDISFNNQVRIPIEQEITEEFLLGLVTFKANNNVLTNIILDLQDFEINDSKIRNNDIVYWVNYENEDIFVVVNVDVYDDTPPYITTDTTIDTNYNDRHDLSRVLTQLSYEDNYSSRLKIKRTIVSDDYTPNIGKVGSYLVKIKLTDENNNSAIYDITINVNTKVPPSIQGDFSLTINTEELNNLENYLKTRYWATSNPEKKDVPVSFIIPDNIPNTKHTFEIQVVATDEYGNTQTRNVEVTLVPTNSKVEIILSQLVIKTTTNQKLNENEIINQVNTVLKESNIDEHVTITDNNYNGFENIEGVYQVGIKHGNTDQKVTYIALEVLEENFNLDIYTYVLAGMAILLGISSVLIIKRVKLKKNLKNN